MNPTDDAHAVHDMAAYYARRAATYERVYHKPERQTDLRAMEHWLAGAFGGRRVLELAAGTGWWTPHGARGALDWLATDLNPETLAIARTKRLPAPVRFATLDAYALELPPSERFDAAFAGFWWSHVPLARLEGWIERLHARLEPGARVVFMDNRYVEGSSTPLARRDADGNTYQARALDDGSTHEVMKNFPAREEAVARLGTRASRPEWIEHRYYWILSYRVN